MHPTNVYGAQATQQVSVVFGVQHGTKPSCCLMELAFQSDQGIANRETGTYLISGSIKCYVEKEVCSRQRAGKLGERALLFSKAPGKPPWSGVI